jgi:fatty acid amide hydrolase 2
MWADAMAEVMGVDGAPSFAEVLGDGAPISLWGECLRTVAGRSSVTFPALALAVLDSVSSRLPRSSRVPKVARVRAELEGILGERGVILHPPYSRPAPRHNAPLLTPTDFVYSSVFSVLQFPVTQVPVGFTSDKRNGRRLPLGVQVAARRGNDPLTIAVAAALEQDFGGWHTAPAR